MNNIGFTPSHICWGFIYLIRLDLFIGDARSHNSRINLGRTTQKRGRCKTAIRGTRYARMNKTSPGSTTDFIQHNVLRNSILCTQYSHLYQSNYYYLLLVRHWTAGDPLPRAVVQLSLSATEIRGESGEREDLNTSKRATCSALRVWEGDCFVSLLDRGSRGWRRRNG